MPSITCPQLPCKSASEVVNGAVSFKPLLDVSELITGTPTVVEVSTSDLTIANVAVNTATLTINDDASVIAGQAVQFNVTGGTAGVDYSLRVTGATDASPAQTRIVRCTLPVVSD